MQRLDHVWSGESWRDDDTGLAATLDGMPEWAGWDAWDQDRQVDELHKLLAQWEHPAEEAEQPLSEDTSQPRWNPDTGMWEIYNTERAEWWAYDGDSGNWFDPVAYQWIPYQSGGDASSAEPANGSVLAAPDDDFIEFDDDDEDNEDEDQHEPK